MGPVVGCSGNWVGTHPEKNETHSVQSIHPGRQGKPLRVFSTAGWEIVPGPVIRPAREDELRELGVIEQEADALFAEIGMNDMATADPETLLPAQRAGRVLVAVTRADEPVGFVRLEIVDSTPHVEQVSVLPGYAGHGLGARLLDAAEEWARKRGYRRMTLITYRDVPWNGPWYRRMGWEVVEEDRLTPELRALRKREGAAGLDVRPRQAMEKNLT